MIKTCTESDHIIFEILAAIHILALLISPENKGVSLPIDCNSKWVEQDNYLSVLTFVYTCLVCHCIACINIIKEYIMNQSLKTKYFH